MVTAAGKVQHQRPAACSSSSRKIGSVGGVSSQPFRALHVLLCWWAGRAAGRRGSGLARAGTDRDRGGSGVGTASRSLYLALLDHFPVISPRPVGRGHLSPGLLRDSTSADANASPVQPLHGLRKGWGCLDWLGGIGNHHSPHHPRCRRMPSMPHFLMVGAGIR